MPSVTSKDGTEIAYETIGVGAPLILVDDSRKDAKLRTDGRLADIVPTGLEIMGIEQPKEMTGRSLLVQ